MIDNRIITAIVALIGVPLVLVGYIVLGERLVSVLSATTRPRARPWIWIGPALAFLVFFLVYPTANTTYLSLLDSSSTNFVGLDNYTYVFTSPDVLNILKNNVLWLVFLTLFTVTLGILIAVLFDRVSYESIAKALVFVPMAISFVAAGVIWKATIPVILVNIRRFREQESTR
jgi:alpha-glucoside transport system permease protein